MKQKKTIFFLECIPLVLFLISFGKLPYGYYILLRWTVSPIFIYLAIVHYKSKKEGWVWIFAVMACLYNPIACVHLGRNIWMVANIASIIILFVAISLNQIRNKNII